MKMMITVITALLMAIVPLVCGNTAEFFSQCGSTIVLTDYDVLMINMDEKRWFGTDKTCQVIFKGSNGFSDNLHFEVTSYDNFFKLKIEVDGSNSGLYWYSVAPGLYNGLAKFTTYGSLRITVTRQNLLLSSMKVQMKMNTDNYVDDYVDYTLAVGAIVGIVIGVICVVGLCIAGTVYLCCCRNKTPGVVIGTTTTQQQPVHAHGYPMTVTQTTVQGTAHPSQPGYPVQGYPSQNQPMYPDYSQPGVNQGYPATAPGYSTQPGVNQGYPATIALPPPYPGIEAPQAK